MLKEAFISLFHFMSDMWMALVTGCDAMQVRVELRDDTGAFSIAAADGDDVDYDEEYEDDDDDGIIAVFPFALRLIF